MNLQRLMWAGAFHFHFNFSPKKQKLVLVTSSLTERQQQLWLSSFVKFSEIIAECLMEAENTGEELRSGQEGAECSPVITKGSRGRDSPHGEFPLTHTVTSVWGKVGKEESWESLCMVISVRSRDLEMCFHRTLCSVSNQHVWKCVHKDKTVFLFNLGSILMRETVFEWRLRGFYHEARQSPGVIQTQVSLFLERDGEEPAAQSYLEAVPRAVTQAWKIPMKNVKGFSFTMTKYMVGRKIPPWMMSPTMTVIMYMPSCRATTSRSAMEMILPQMRQAMPRGEYLHRDTCHTPGRRTLQDMGTVWTEQPVTTWWRRRASWRSRSGRWRTPTWVWPFLPFCPWSPRRQRRIQSDLQDTAKSHFLLDQLSETVFIKLFRQRWWCGMKCLTFFNSDIQIQRMNVFHVWMNEWRNGFYECIPVCNPFNFIHTEKTLKKATKSKSKVTFSGLAKLLFNLWWKHQVWCTYCWILQKNDNKKTIHSFFFIPLFHQRLPSFQK